MELAKAEVAKGQADTKICQTCHSFDKGGPIRVGPPLWGVVGRPKGSFPGFNYSEGMKSKGGDWTYDDLNEFLTKPSAYVAGTKMTFGGEAEESKRADIVDYLHTLSDNPLPLPTPRGGAGSCGDASADSCEDAGAGADSCRRRRPPAPTAAATPDAGADSRGDAHADADSRGDALAGAVSCGDAHAGADSCGDAHAGADSCGDPHAGADSRGDAHAGADSCGDANAGADSCGDAQRRRRRAVSVRRHAGADRCATPTPTARRPRSAAIRAVTVGNADAGEISRARTPRGPRARGPSRFA